jgi:hypothetical protein
MSFTCYSQWALYDYLCKKWKLEHATNPNMLPSIERVKNIIHGHPMDLNNLEDLDRVLLCNRPSQITIIHLDEGV